MQFQQGRGRRKQYCSQACRQRAYEHRSGKIQPEVSQVLFRLSRWENLEYAKKI